MKQPNQYVRSTALHIRFSLYCCLRDCTFDSVSLVLTPKHTTLQLESPPRITAEYQVQTCLNSRQAWVIVADEAWTSACAGMEGSLFSCPQIISLCLHCRGIHFAKMFVYAHCPEKKKKKQKKKAALVRVQISCHLFSKNFRHWHRFPIVSHLSSYLSHSFRNNHIPQQGMQGQWGLEHKLLGRGYGNHPPALKASAMNKSLLTSEEGSEDTLDRRPLESAVYPLLIFPTPQSKTVQVLWETGWHALIKHQQQVRTQAVILGCRKLTRWILITKAAAQM